MEPLERRCLLSGFTTLYDFTGGAADGGKPGAIISDSNGNLYGATLQGGNSGSGTVFEFVNSTNTLATLAQLPRGADVAISYVAVDSSGNVFAVDAGSGANGAIDEVVKGGNQITALASFNGTNGTTPDSLILDGAGDLFGTTEIGGSGNNGTIFELLKGGNTITSLYSFPSYYGALASDDARPASLILDGSGNIFGWTDLGGANDFGTLFKLNIASKTFTPLASFNGTTGGPGDFNGARYSGEGLLLDSSGNLFGAVAGGNGSIFEVAKGTNTLTTVASFNGTNGGGPSALIIDSHGNLFGTTLHGGASNYGTIFEIAHGTNTIRTLYSFTNGLDGSIPYSLAFDSQGNLLGSAYAGGLNQNGGNQGTLFRRGVCRRR